MKSLFIFSTFILFLPVVLTINASPHPFNEKQPDDSSVQLHIIGTAQNHQLIDTNGYIVTTNSANWIVYAELDELSGVMASGTLIVGKDDPTMFGLKKDIKSSIEHPGSRRDQQAPSQRLRTKNKLITTGNLRNLVILLKFSDHMNRDLPNQYQLNTLFNSLGGEPEFAPTGSVKDFYAENSYGKLVLDSTIYPWISLPKPEAYYSKGFISEAINYALDEIDRNQDYSLAEFDSNGDNVLDMITVLHSGYGAEWGATDCNGQHYKNRIWSHKSSLSWRSKSGISVNSYHISPSLWGTCGSEIGRIGVLAHELGHFFGLPDLYDTYGGNGIGSYDLMSNCWGFDGSQLYPPSFSAWSKIQLGWVLPRVITESGVYEIPAVIKRPVVLVIQKGFPAGEYLLIENRQPLGFDSKIPQGGLAIWHIDEKAGISTEGFPGQISWPHNGKHYRVALLQADGLYELEQSQNTGNSGDLWRANGKAYLGTSHSALGPFPNTDAYQNGEIIRTGIEVSEISMSGIIMSFRVTF